LLLEKFEIGWSNEHEGKETFSRYIWEQEMCDYDFGHIVYVMIAKMAHIVTTYVDST